jgi:DNA-binding transcriptional LysR family regulator
MGSIPSSDDLMNLAQLDLNLLVALDALLRDRNVTRAGEAIGLSQPAMSSALARLRRMFNDELLVRVGREYHLTTLAQELEGPLAHILHEIEQTFESRPTFDPASDERVFSVSASDYATFLLVGPMMQQAAVEAPNVTIQVLPLDSHSRAGLEAGETDLIIMPSSIGPDLPSQDLFADRYVCVVSQEHEAVGTSISLEDYLSLPGVTYGRGISAIESTGDRSILAGGKNLHIRLTVESFFLIPFLVVATPLVGLVHERLARRLTSAANIRIVEPLFETPVVSETMYWHPRRTTDPAHRWLRDMLKKAAESV